MPSSARRSPSMWHRYGWASSKTSRGCKSLTPDCRHLPQMSQEPFGERLGMLPMHEMPAWDLLDDVLVLEHPGGAPIVRCLGDRIIQARKHHHWNLDSRLQRCAGYRGELAVIAERSVQARRV